VDEGGERGKTIGAVVVGTGFGCLTHVRALRAAGFDIVALVGRDPDKTEERARRFDVPHALTDLSRALGRDDVEAVSIATPPHTHAALALEAIAAGKHVLCEKPFTRDAAEARQLLGAAEAAHVVHFLGTEFRWSTGQALARRVIAEGAIGEPRLATFLLHIPMLADPAGELPGWWRESREGGGWLGAQGAHVVDQVRVTLGEFTGVSASLDLVSDRAMSAEDGFTVHFRLQSGVAGIMQSTAGAWGPPLFTTRIAGTSGTLWIDFDTVSIADRDGTRQVPVPDDLRLAPPDPPPADLLVSAYDQLHAFGIDLAPYTRLAEAFRDRILGREPPADPPPATFAHGVADMIVLDAIRRAAAERTWVEIT
jgi:predicted dehydrogenase